MKKLIWSTFVAFWASVITILALAWLAPDETVATAAEPDGERVVTLAELAEHATPDDCWMAIRGRVYDFSAYIPQHPTPPAVMTAWCGKEATEPYDTKGYGRPHSPAADALLDHYFIGVLAGDID
jgi:cytochrome b involved in lipid metabolism